MEAEFLSTYNGLVLAVTFTYRDPTRPMRLTKWPDSVSSQSSQPPSPLAPVAHQRKVNGNPQYAKCEPRFMGTSFKRVSFETLHVIYFFQNICHKLPQLNCTRKTLNDKLNCCFNLETIDTDHFPKTLCWILHANTKDLAWQQSWASFLKQTKRTTCKRWRRRFWKLQVIAKEWHSNELCDSDLICSVIYLSCLSLMAQLASEILCSLKKSSQVFAWSVDLEKMGNDGWFVKCTIVQMRLLVPWLPCARCRTKINSLHRHFIASSHSSLI